MQGIGGGAIFTVSVSIVNNAFAPDERAKALGIWSGVGLAGSAIGPFVAGILTQYASWRWFFFLNIPIGIATILLTLALRRGVARRELHGRHRLDGLRAR